MDRRFNVHTKDHGDGGGGKSARDGINLKNHEGEKAGKLSHFNANTRKFFFTS
jgi:hypothetical protein